MGSTRKWSLTRKSFLTEERSSRSQVSFNDLPVELVLHLASYLSFNDLLSLCHTNRYLFSVLSNEESAWKKFIREHISCRSRVLEASAKPLSTIRASRPGLLKESEIKINYMLHRKTQRNWSSGNFNHVKTLNARARFSRPPRFLEFNASKIVGLDFNDDSDDYFYTLEVWDVVTRTSLSFQWKSEVWGNLRQRRRLYEVNSLITDGTVAIIHFGPYRLEPVSMASCDHVIAALDFSHGDHLEDLWQHVPENRKTEWSIFNVKERLYRLVESAGHFRVDQIDILTGNVIQRFFYEDFLPANSQYVVKDDAWIVFPVINAILFRKIDFIALDADDGATKFLAQLPRPIFSVPKLSIRSGRVFTFLDDCSIPVWDLWTGDLLMLVSKNNPMLNNFSSDSFQARPMIVKNYDDSRDTMDIVVMSLTDNRQVRKVTSFIESNGDFKFVANRSFKFENPDSILDVFVIHDHFFVCFVTYIGWLKFAISPMQKLPNETGRATQIIKLFKVRELTFARKVHVHVTPNLAIVKTPDKIHILDFSAQDKARKKSFTGKVMNAIGL